MPKLKHDKRWGYFFMLRTQYLRRNIADECFKSMQGFAVILQFLFVYDNQALPLARFLAAVRNERVGLKYKKRPQHKHEVFFLQDVNKTLAWRVSDLMQEQCSDYPNVLKWQP